MNEMKMGKGQIMEDLLERTSFYLYVSFKSLKIHCSVSVKCLNVILTILVVLLRYFFLLLFMKKGILLDINEQLSIS